MNKKSVSQPPAFKHDELKDVKKAAALDIGSNSFHLVVVRIVAGSVQILHTVKEKVRLAQDLDENNVLSQEAIDRGLGILRIVAETLKGFEPDNVRIVATHTLRKAINAKQFIKAAKAIIPYPIEVIPGTEEARLIYSGVAHTTHHEGKRLVIDIGGGSTEFVIGEEFEPKLCRSIQMGCVSYTQYFFIDGELNACAFNKAITSVEQALELIEGKFMKTGWDICLGTSGTIKALFKLVQIDRPNGHDIPITLKSLNTLMQQFIEVGHVNKLSFPDLSDDRKPVIAAGLAILIGIFKTLKIDELIYSSAALREGVIYEMEATLKQQDIRGRTATSLASRYDVDTAQANLVLKTTMTLYDACAKRWKIKQAEHKSMLGWAALLHEVGLQVNSRGVQRHSAYILSNSDMPGFSQEQQELLSTLVRYHRKKVSVQEIVEFNQYDSEVVYKLIALLRLAVVLNIKRQENYLPDFKIVSDKAGCTILFPPGWLDQRRIIAADLAREMQYWEALNLKLFIQPDPIL
ncbi:exopolyphosphatase [Alteromonas sp. ASW11-130]|uniref:exopolyphosphatase n=1 Tax=Alteromonas sp. ASW11-130 TaxID=3015775 RepID=UPI002241CBEF|nr:exopolyphosphatase [Alteromonas sp. ASW11-130]MCW8090421.1 exopolyphosphatase [Alteromonas sp. ASW11-130]